MRGYDYYSYLSDQEAKLLDQSILTVNLLNEVAILRARNEELEMERLKQMKETQKQLDHNNAFIGNILCGLIERTEKL